MRENWRERDGLIYVGDVDKEEKRKAYLYNDKNESSGVGYLISYMIVLEAVYLMGVALRALST